MAGRIISDYHKLADELARLGARSLALTNGCFDLLHVGHVRLLLAGAIQAETFVVALNTDETVTASKGPGRPVVPLAERMEVVAGIAGVDFVTSFPEPTADEMILVLRPDVYVKGTDWTPETVPERSTVEAFGGRVVICGDPKTHSSTELIQRHRTT